MKFKQAYWK